MSGAKAFLASLEDLKSQLKKASNSLESTQKAFQACQESMDSIFGKPSEPAAADNAASSKPAKPATKEEFLAVIEKMKDVDEIATHYGVSKPTISIWFKKDFGIEWRKIKKDRIEQQEKAAKEMADAQQAEKEIRELAESIKQ